MDKILNYISDAFVFWNLKKISNGHLDLIDSAGKTYSFGNNKSFLRAKMKINDPSFCYKILRRGSSGLGESYMNSEFETEDLTSLIASFSIDSDASLKTFSERTFLMKSDLFVFR